MKLEQKVTLNTFQIILLTFGMESIMVLSCIHKHIYRLVRTLNLFFFLSGFAIFSATNVHAENWRNLLEMSQFANICQQQKDNFPI